jgi:type I restriction enzyme, S subunit
MSSEWAWRRLGDHCLKIGSGSTPTGGKDGYLEQGPFMLIRSQNIYNDGFKPNGLAFISAEQARKLDGVAIEVDDVLLNITGDSVARVCLARSQYLPARVNQHVAIIRPKPDVFDSRYLRYFLASACQQDLMLGMAAAGATRNALTKAMIEGFKVPCPPMAIQRSIADILSALDDRITLLRETNATLEAIAQALFKSWFVDFDPVRAKLEGRTPEGMDEATAALFPDGFVESELGLVPRGWRVGTLEDCCSTVQSGGTPKRTTPEYWDGDISWLTSGEVRNPIVFDSKEKITALGVKESSAKLWPSGTTVVAMYGATAGEVCLLAQPTTANQACCGLIPRDGFRAFLFFCVRRERENLASKSSGSAQQNLNKGLVTSHQALLPCVATVVAYENVVGALLDSWIQNEKQAQTLATLRDTLLPRLISGAFRLPEAELQIQETTK